MWESVFKNQAAQVNSRAAAVERGFAVGDPVMVRDFRPKHPRWQPAVVYAREVPKSYQVALPGGGVPWRRHSNQMVHGPEGVTLDQPSTGEPDEEDIPMQASADTALPAPVVESLPNTGLQSGSPKTPVTRQMPGPARDQPMNQGGGGVVMQDQHHRAIPSHQLPRKLHAMGG